MGGGQHRARARNFGWPCYEGGDQVNLIQGGYSGLSRCQDFYASGETVTPSIHGYVHEGGSSVQVGDFYQGSAYPAAYQGALFISDFDQGWIKTLSFDIDGNVASVDRFGTEPGVVLIREGIDTNLYLVNILEGKIKRLRYDAGGNTPPIARVGADPTLGPGTSLTVTFSSAGSVDPDGDPISFAWDFGDGNSSNEADPTHTFTSSGVFNAVLTVTDINGASTTDTVSILVGESRPVATISSPDVFTYDIGDTINFSGSGFDNEDGALPGGSLEWQVLLHHNDHFHYDAPATTGTSGSYLITDHGDNTWLELCLTATDSAGLTGETCVSLYPNTSPVTLETVPAGLTLPWEGCTRQTPYTVDTIVNAQTSSSHRANRGALHSRRGPTVASASTRSALPRHRRRIRPSTSPRRAAMTNSWDIGPLTTAMVWSRATARATATTGRW